MTHSIIPFHQESIEGFLHVPNQPLGDGLVLTHGAGGNCQAPLLTSVATAFALIGFHVLRCNLPFRQKRRFGPPAPAHAAGDRNGLKDAVAALRQIVLGRLFLGGHSYGGRQASMLASEDPSLADALLLLSYPLHPPNSPDKPRTAHFPQLLTPSLFVHGTNDPFGSIEELQSALKLIPSPTELSIVQKAGHDLGGGKIEARPLIVDCFSRLIESTVNRSRQ